MFCNPFPFRSVCSRIRAGCGLLCPPRFACRPQPPVPPPTPGTLTVFKTDRDTGLPVPGAVFTLTNSQTGAVMTASSDAQGRAVFSPLPPGRYFLTEIQPPAGYQPHPFTHIIIVENNGNVLVDGHASNGSLIIDDVPVLTPGSLTLSKADRDTGFAVPGAEFTLANTQTGASTAAQTDAHGQAAFQSIQPGNYLLRETRTPAGYAPNDAVHAVTVQNNGTVLVDGQPTNHIAFSNVPAAVTGVLTIHKTDRDTGLALPGAEFTLIHTLTGSSMAAVSDFQGRAVFGAIPPGSYHLVETGVPPGYEPLLLTITVTVESNGTVRIDGSPSNDLYVGNIPIRVPGALTLYKIDSTTGRYLPGAEFALSNNQTGEVTAGITDGRGTLVFSPIQPGVYTLAEIRPPAGFEPHPIVHTITVENNGSVLIDGTQNDSLIVYDIPYLIPGALTVRKSDYYTALPLYGAEFTLTNIQTGAATIVVSDPQGYAVFGSIQPGAYLLAETQPPAGYEPYTTIYSVTVENNGEVFVDGSPSNDIVVRNMPANVVIT